MDGETREQAQLETETTMHKFARIIETPTTQALFYVSYDNDEDETVLHQIIRTPDGINADVALRFGGDQQEERAQASLDKVNEGHALKVVAMVENILNGEDDA